MNKSSEEGGRLLGVARISLALPEAIRTLTGDHASICVRDKRFANYLDDHHGDGIAAVCFRSESRQNTVLLAADKTRFYGPAYIGSKGWVGSAGRRRDRLTRSC